MQFLTNSTTKVENHFSMDVRNEKQLIPFLVLGQQHTCMLILDIKTLQYIDC